MSEVEVAEGREEEPGEAPEGEIAGFPETAGTGESAGGVEFPGHEERAGPEEGLRCEHDVPRGEKHCARCRRRIYL